jgi:hypothetical protein
MSAEPEDNRLPFEPKKKRQKPAKALSNSTTANQESGNKEKKKPRYTKEETAIPQVVSQRMIRRVAGFCGVPTALGIGSLVCSYLLLIYAGVKLPPVAVLLVNMGFFGLGVLGITYGVLSASWDEDRVGTLLGWSEFTTNSGRMIAAWRETRQKNI